jgi:ribonuclease-3 family protein
VTADLSRRSIRTLAWLGDAAFEREVRWRIAARGDYPVDRLNAIKAEVVCAEAQAHMFAAIAERLDAEEASLARRARNTEVKGRMRGRTRAYRDATALEALIAAWQLGAVGGPERFDQMLAEQLEAAIDAALELTDRRRRG